MRVCPKYVLKKKSYKCHTVISASVGRSHIPGHVAVFDVAASRSRRKSVRLNARRFRCQRPPVRRSITNVQGSTGVYDAQCRVPHRRTDASPPPVTTGADPRRMGDSESRRHLQSVVFYYRSRGDGTTEDEYHALHTIVGKTGAVPGAVALPSEGKQHVRTSITEILPEPCRVTTLWVFSDNPSTMLGCADVFPNLKELQRIPSIWPCASNAASQAKGWLCRVWFLICIASFVLHMKQRYTLEKSKQWASKVFGRLWSNIENYSLRADWDNYCATPFRWHQEYIDELTKIAQAHPEEMERVGTDKRTVLEVIMSGSAFQHYAYLMNGCQVMYEMPAASRRTLAWGDYW